MRTTQYNLFIGALWKLNPLHSNNWAFKPHRLRLRTNLNSLLVVVVLLQVFAQASAHGSTNDIVSVISKECVDVLSAEVVIHAKAWLLQKNLPSLVALVLILAGD